MWYDALMPRRRVTYTQVLNWRIENETKKVSEIVKKRLKRMNKKAKRSRAKKFDPTPRVRRKQEI